VSVHYVKFDGKTVSSAWATLLHAARLDHVAFELDSGHRTMAEQRHQVALHGIWSPSNPHGAAVPSPTAPHIRIGRPDHALDINSLDGGANRFFRWLVEQGGHPRFTVPPEPWHIELPLADLLRLQRRFRHLFDPYHFLGPNERRWCREYDRLKRTNRNRPRRRELRKKMTHARKAIWVKATHQHNGWHKFHRLERYRALRARST
jgi:hypothetical protein